MNNKIDQNIQNICILNYNQDDYKNAYASQFIAPFNHGPMTKGPINKEDANQYISELREKAKAISPAISFDDSKLENELEGGSCSSIALIVAKSALNYLKGPNQGVNGLKECLQETISKIGKTKSDRLKIRTIQAAFNTIFVKPDVQAADIRQEKIKALAAYYNIKVLHSTDELIIDEHQACQEHFYETIKKLEAGVYLTRIIIKENNHKLEKCGHSTVYIKLPQGEELYFDTQLGLYDLTQNQNQKIHFINHAFYSAKKRFNIDCGKFHQLSL